MREKDIEAEVCRYAREKYKALTYKFTSPGRRNVPDRIFVFPSGLVMFVEFKSATGRPTDGQLREMNRLDEYQQNVVVVNSIESGKSAVDYYVQRVGGFWE